MIITYSSIEKFLETIKTNTNIVTSDARIGEIIDEEYFHTIEDDLYVKYPNSYMKFIFEICTSFKLEWKLSNKFSSQLNLKNDGSLIQGKIKTLGPKVMIKDDVGGYWEGLFWFDGDKSEMNENFRMFVPFDMSDGANFITGFLKNGNDEDGWRICEQLYLNRENEGLEPHPFSFEEYIEFILKTKGYLNFMGCYNHPNSADFERFMTVMPKIFEDFDAAYFERLSKRK